VPATTSTRNIPLLLTESGKLITQMSVNILWITYIQDIWAYIPFITQFEIIALFKWTTFYSLMKHNILSSSLTKITVALKRHKTKTSTVIWLKIQYTKLWRDADLLCPYSEPACQELKKIVVFYVTLPLLTSVVLISILAYKLVAINKLLTFIASSCIDCCAFSVTISLVGVN
jgi:hypothetical protein